MAEFFFTEKWDSTQKTQVPLASTVQTRGSICGSFACTGIAWGPRWDRLLQKELVEHHPQQNMDYWFSTETISDDLKLSRIGPEWSGTSTHYVASTLCSSFNIHERIIQEVTSPWYSWGRPEGDAACTVGSVFLLPPTTCTGGVTRTHTHAAQETECGNACSSLMTSPSWLT